MWGWGCAWIWCEVCVYIHLYVDTIYRSMCRDICMLIPYIDLYVLIPYIDLYVDICRGRLVFEEWVLQRLWLLHTHTHTHAHTHIHARTHAHTHTRTSHCLSSARSSIVAAHAHTLSLSHFLSRTHATAHTHTQFAPSIEILRRRGIHICRENKYIYTCNIYLYMHAYICIYVCVSSRNTHTSRK